MLDKYGTDAFRFTLAMLRLKVRCAFVGRAHRRRRNFVNKLWNASRLTTALLDNKELEGGRSVPVPAGSLDTVAMQKVAKEVEDSLNAYRYSEAAKHFTVLCGMSSATVSGAGQTKSLRQGNRVRMRKHGIDPIQDVHGHHSALHPFMPFITEELYQRMPSRRKRVSWCCLSGYDSEVDEQAESSMNMIMGVIDVIRNIRARWFSRRKIEARLRANRHGLARGICFLYKELAKVETCFRDGRTPNGPQSACTAR